MHLEAHFLPHLSECIVTARATAVCFDIKVLKRYSDFRDFWERCKGCL